MKILHVTNNYPTPSNPVFGIFVKEQIDSLTSIGVENKVFFINGREKGKLEYLMSVLRLKRFLENRKFDVIHCHHAFSALCLILSGHSKGNNVIVSFQQDPSVEIGNILYRLISKFSNAIILKNISPKIDNKKVYYLPNGVNIDFFSSIDREISCEKIGIDKTKKYILFVSSNFVRKEKRYDRFKKVLLILKTKYKLPDLEELKLINTKRELVPYYFNASSVHLLTSDFEGSPNSVKEALACNIPVVSTNVGDVEELLSGIKGSYMSNSNSPEELAGLVYKVLTSNGFETFNSRVLLIKKELEITSVAKKLISIYNKLTNE